jgi:Peptidase family M49
VFPRIFLLAAIPMIAFSADAHIEAQLAKWKPVKMPFDASQLSPREGQMVDKLVEAGQYMELIYWEQSDPAALNLYRATHDADLKRFLMINGCRYDLIDDNRPFVGSEPAPPGRNLYPQGLTRARVEQYVREHPDQKAATYSPYTVIRRRGKQLVAIPYSVEFRQPLEHAARALREAAALSDDPAFAKFLRARADAFSKDDYYPSDLDWMDLKHPKFDVILGPYETYLDGLLGVKTSFSSAILIRNEPESAKLELYQKYVPEIQDALPLPRTDLPSKKGLATPMEVMDAPFRSGDLRHGYEAVADNLPNDPRIHEKKGTKKIFFKNFMDARVDYVILPLAKQVMRADQAAKASGEGYLATTVLHEISHGLGPAYARINGKQVDIREAIGPTYSALEEAKADVVGMFGLKWLIDHGALPKDRLEGFYASYLAGLFRTMRYGIAEAHGRAEMMEFNFLSERRAIVRDGDRYAIDYARMPAAIDALAKELLEIEATGDRARAENWFAKYDRMPVDVAAALKQVKGIPVDIDPIFAFSEFPKQ